MGEVRVSGGLRSLRSLRPSHRLLRPLRELVSGGPLPLYVSEGGHTPGHISLHPCRFPSRGEGTSHYDILPLNRIAASLRTWGYDNSAYYRSPRYHVFFRCSLPYKMLDYWMGEREDVETSDAVEFFLNEGYPDDVINAFLNNLDGLQGFSRRKKFRDGKLIADIIYRTSQEARKLPPNQNPNK